MTSQWYARAHNPRPIEYGNGLKRSNAPRLRARYEVCAAAATATAATATAATATATAAAAAAAARPILR